MGAMGGILDKSAVKRRCKPGPSVEDGVVDWGDMKLAL